MILKGLRYLKHVTLFKLKGNLLKNSKNTKKISEMKGKYQGKRCFIIATGPSLTVEDLEMLSDEDTFAVNSIFLLYDRTKWRPKYYVCTDAPYLCKLVNSYNLGSDKLSKEELFLNSDTKKLNREFANNKKIRWISFSPWNRIYDFNNYQFNDDIANGMYAFGTVTNISIAIAMYLGYTDIYLIGADCSNLNRHFINDVTDADKDDEYVKNVIHAQLRGYEIMKHETEIRGVNVYNATRGGALEVFRRVNLDEVLKGESK